MRRVALMHARVGRTHTMHTMHGILATHAAHTDEISGDLLERGLPITPSAAPSRCDDATPSALPSRDDDDTVLLEQVC